MSYILECSFTLLKYVLTLNNLTRVGLVKTGVIVGCVSNKESNEGENIYYYIFCIQDGFQLIWIFVQNFK